MRRSTRILFILWFAVLLAVPGLASISSSRDTIANRPVREFPELRGEALQDGTFFAEVDDFVQDRLSIREWAINTDAALSVNLFEDSPNSTVYLGDDGVLFLAATYDDPCQDAMNPNWPEVETVAERLNGLRDALGEDGAELFITVIPEKGWIYPDLLPGVVENEECAERLVTELRDTLADQPGYIDLFSMLIDAAADQDGLVYQRTDSHWTNQMRAVVAERIIDEIQPGVFSREHLVIGEPLEKPDGGDLAALIQVSIPDSDATISTAPDGITTEIIETPGPHRRWNSQAADPDNTPLIPGRTVILSDSHLNLSASFYVRYFEDLHLLTWAELQSESVEATVMEADRILLASTARFAQPRLTNMSQLFERYRRSGQ